MKAAEEQPVEVPSTMLQSTLVQCEGTEEASEACTWRLLSEEDCGTHTDHKAPPPASYHAAHSVHVAVQCFTDYLWIIVTEDDNCAPGVILQHAAPSLIGTGAFLYNGEVPSIECEVLLGMRDHPLTNLLASTLVRAVRQCGEPRALFFCLNVVHTARLLGSTAARKAFLHAVQEEVLRLAEGQPRQKVVCE